MQSHFKTLNLLLGFTILFSGSTLYGQWPSFTFSDLDGAGFTKNTQPYFSMISSQISTHPFVSKSPDQRFRSGVNITGALSYSDLNKIGIKQGLLPTAEGIIVASSNLAFHGMVSGLIQSSGFVYMHGWGFRLFLTDNPGNDWSVSTKFSKIYSPDYYRLTSIDGVCEKEWTVSNIHFYTGFGSNYYKSRIFFEGDNIPTLVQDSFPYLVLGVIYKYHSFSVIPNIQNSKNGLLFNIEILKGFH